MRIWKTELAVADLQTIKAPKGSQILTAQFQDGQLCLWFLCDPEAPASQKAIAIYGTGGPVPDTPGRYVSTVQAGPMVWHVFEIVEGE